MLGCEMPEVDTTHLLLQARGGSPSAQQALWPHVYEELRALAHRRLLGHRPGETLHTTALVHEAYLRLFDGRRVDYQDRTHFVALAARAMRFVLVDHVRACLTDKRGGALPDIAFDEDQHREPDERLAERATDLLSLHDALERLSALDDRLTALVEYRFFGGLTYEEIADVTGLSLRTVKRDWRRARTWLFRFMHDQPVLSA